MALQRLLEDQGVDVKGMNTDKMHDKLCELEDFSNQTLLEELVLSKGHTCLYLLKYHCELNQTEISAMRSCKTM